MLAGRAALQQRLASVVDAARSGRAGSLLLHGEAGIGKTTLIDTLGEPAGFVCTRARGIESERGLAFAGLVDLLRPLRPYCGDVPTAVAELLDDLLAGSPLGATGRDRFAVGAAVLTTLATAADRVPLLVIVDDLQWWDRPSTEALLFAIRRLRADRVGSILASRTGEALPAPVDGIETLDVPPLDLGDAAELLADRCVPAVAAALFTAVGGNPLALVQAGNLLTAAQRRGTAALPRPLPVPPSLSAGFAAQLATLPDRARHALAAVALIGDDRHAVRTALLAELGLATADLLPAEEAGLLQLGSPVRWRHPLVVAAAVDAVPAATVRDLRRAAAQVLPAHSPERAWHLAHSADGPDVEATRALVQAGREAADRSAYADAAAAYERAAQLSPGHRPDLIAIAAEYAWRGGDADTTLRLCDAVIAGTADCATRADALALRGRVEHLGGRATRAVTLLREAADLWRTVDPARAVDVLSDAFVAALLTGEADLLDRLAREVGELADAADDAQRMLTDYTAGVARLYRHDPAGQALVEAAARQLIDGLADRDPARFTFHLLTAGGWLDRHELGERTIIECIAVLRQRGDLAALPKLVKIRAVHALSDGLWDTAYVHALDALELARMTGQMAQGAEGLLVLGEIEAARGQDERACARLEEARRLIDSFGIGWWRPALARVDALRLLARGNRAQPPRCSNRPATSR